MNEKNTVLIVGPTPPPMGGIATYVDDMLKSNINNEYNIIHLNTAREHSIKKSFVKNLLLFTKNTFKLIYILYIHQLKIVHIHTSSYLAFWEKSIFVIISKVFLKKVVLHIHGAEFDRFYENGSNFNKYLIKKMLSIPDRVIVLSMRWKDFFLPILNDAKISVIQNGIVFSKFQKSKKKINDNSSTELKVLFLGNIVRRKGVYDILNSIPIVLNEFKNVHFIFAGSEEQLGEIAIFKNECIRKNIEEYVTFKSNFSEDEKIKLLVESDIYLLPSYAEGLPISLLEAMAVGLPIISTAVGGIPEVITEGENGFLITPGDYVQLATKIIELIESPKVRMIMGELNHDKIRKNYDWKIIASNISNVYCELLQNQNNY